MPYRAVGGADVVDLGIGEFCYGFLYKSSVLAYYIGVVTVHFRNIHLHVGVRIKDAAVDCAKASECVT